MKFLIECDRENQVVYVEGRYPRPSTIAPYRDVIRPGENAGGLVYEELMALGSGFHEITLPEKTEHVPAA